MSKHLELFAVAAGRIASALAAIVVLYAMTRLLPVREYTLVALFTAFQSFAGLVLGNPAGQWLTRHVHEWHDSRVLLHHHSLLNRFVGVGAALTGLACGFWFVGVSHGTVTQAVVAGGALFGAVWFSTYAMSSAMVLNALGYRQVSVIWQIAMAWLPLGFSIVFAAYRPEAVAWLAGQAAGSGVASLVVRLGLNRLLREQTEKTPSAFYLDAAYWRYALPLAALTSMMWLYGNGYRFVLERSWDATTLGLFLLALSIPAQMTAVMESVVMQYAYPYYFRRIAGSADVELQAEATSSMTNALLPLYWVWGGFLCLAAPQVLYVIAAPQYHGAVQWLIAGTLLEVARLSANAWTLTAQARKDFRPLVVPAALGAFGSLAAAIITYRAGGSPWFFAGGLLLAAVLQSILSIHRARGMLPIRLSTKRAAFAGAVLLGALFLSFPLQTNRGVASSLAIILLAAGVTGWVAFQHLRSAAFFHALLRQKLS